jgi:predicted nucleotidyltransferase
MNITGIIVEYNPFHKGHLYHIQKTKELTNCHAIVAVMSGNFVQRGIPAMIDKWNRTRMALEHGVDLVLELPLVYSLSSAEFFSQGAISILNNLGVVNNICFGSEFGDANILYDISKIFAEEPELFRKFLKENLNIGFSYPDSRSKALMQFIKNNNHNKLNIDIEKILYSSNNILGIEYCKSIIKLKSSIKPFSIRRKGSSYDSVLLENDFSSATSIRKFIKEKKVILGIKNYVPERVFHLISDLDKNNYNFVFEDSIFPYLKYKYMLNKNSIEKLPDVSEGIHNRIYKSLNIAKNYDELISLIKTKRYTRTRIDRILHQFFIGFENFNISEMRKQPCPFIRVLGFNSMGLEILRKAKQKSSVPIYTKLPKDLNEFLSLDIQGTKIYSLLNNNIQHNSDYLISPIIIK